MRSWESAPLPHCHLKPSKTENHFLPQSHQYCTRNHCNSLSCRSSWRQDHPHLLRSRFLSWWWRESLWPPPRERWAGQACWEPRGLKDKGSRVRLSPCDPLGLPPRRVPQVFIFKDALKNRAYLMRQTPFMWNKVCFAFTHYLTTRLQINNSVKTQEIGDWISDP